MTAHKITFHRDKENILGMLTLANVWDDGESVIYGNLPARSGQCGYTHTDWIPAKSPIPSGEFWMATQFVPLLSEPKGTPFFHIGSQKGTNTIYDAKSAHHRTDVGLHLENNKPGSEGCVVLLWDTIQRKEKAFALFSYLTKLKNSEPYIRFTVL